VSCYSTAVQLYLELHEGVTTVLCEGQYYVKEELHVRVTKSWKI
jgi:hypothetical protein